MLPPFYPTDPLISLLIVTESIRTESSNGTVLRPLNPTSTALKRQLFLRDIMKLNLRGGVADIIENWYGNHENAMVSEHRVAAADPVSGGAEKSREWLRARGGVIRDTKVRRNHRRGERGSHSEERSSTTYTAVYMPALIVAQTNQGIDGCTPFPARTRK